MKNPLHPAEVRIHKKFKEYFWEFLMIFLAVTLGFLAENIRASITDRSHVAERVKADAVSFMGYIDKTYHL